MRLRGIQSGFGFLAQTAGFDIGETLFAYESVDPYWRAFAVGVANTLRVALVGIVVTTVLGTLIGIAKLSRNWLLSRVAGAYVEIIRDLPLLLQLLFWYALMQLLPGPRQALNPIEGVFLSNRGMKLPFIHWQDAHTAALLAFVAGCAGAWLYARARRAAQMRDGQPRAAWPGALVLMLGLPTLAVVAIAFTDYELGAQSLRYVGLANFAELMD
ncbi:MAG: ABC transporter permease subunit, partial [Burkholderiaceae bacterium]|nr:ABC transporter permease subunit [Burkholderiaceae bacterium]